MKNIFSALLCAALFLSLSCPVLAAEQMSNDETAAAWVQEQGIYCGDSTGDLMLDKSLNRAELAVLLTRLKGVKTEDLLQNANHYSLYCGFTDVPEWARPYVGWCVQHDLLSGYDKFHYGAADPVTPAAACTVMLRVRDIADGGGSVWNYGTAVSYAASLGWLDQPTVDAAAITRGDMAVLIYRAMTGSRPVDPQSVGTGDGYLTNGEPITEENVLELLHEIEIDWPHGTVWGTSKTPETRKNEVPSRVARWVMNLYRVNGYYACGGYAAMVSSLIFGDVANPARQVEDLSQIRPGDIIILIRNDTGKIWHVSIALESPNEMHAFHYTDGNHGGIVSWPDAQSPYSRENLDCYGEGKTYRVEAWTRYPENVPYTGQSMNAWGIPAPNR